LQASERDLYALIDKKTSDDLTLILKLKKSASSKIFILFRALSTSASGHGSLYFSNIFFSKEPAFIPTLTEQLLSFAALRISLTFSLEPILPGLILKQSAPEIAASTALL